MKALIVLFGLVVGLLLFSLFWWIPVYLLWNWIMPLIFGLPEISFIQALGVVLLSSILFKSSSGSK